MDIFGNQGNTFDQALNTYNDVDFARVDVTDAIVSNQQLATKLYVDTHGGGGGITYSGVNPATDKIYKASGATGLDATNSTITDNGTLVTVSATNGITANKVAITAGTNQQYLMADGSLLEASAQNGNANFYLYNNVNGLSVPPPSNGQVTYNATTLAATTLVYISHLTRDGVDIDVYLTLITTLDDLYIQDQSNSVNFAKYNITGSPTLNPNNYITIPVSQVQFGGNGNTAFGSGHDILVSFFSNLQEVNTRLTTLETKTANQTAAGGTTTMAGPFIVKNAAADIVNVGSAITLGTVATNTTPIDITGILTITNRNTVMPIKNTYVSALDIINWNSVGTGATETVGIKVTTVKNMVITALGCKANVLLGPGDLRLYYIRDSVGAVIGSAYSINKSVFDPTGLYIQCVIPPLTLVPGTYYFGITVANGDYSNQAAVTSSYIPYDTNVISAFAGCYSTAPDSWPNILAGNRSLPSFWVDGYSAIKVGSVIISNGTSSQVLLADGSITDSVPQVATQTWGVFNVSFTSGAVLAATSGYFSTAALTAIGSVTTIVAQTTSSSLTKIFRVANPTSSVGGGQRSGYIGSTSMPKLFPGLGFNWNISFGIGDSNSTATAVTQMLCGFSISTTAPLFGVGVGPNVTPSIMGFGHDFGDASMSFYNRGTTTGTKTATQFSTATPSAYWFNLNIYSEIGSNAVTLVLTEVTTGLSETITYAFGAPGSTSLIVNTSQLYPIYCRGMANAGGTTGSAITHFARFQLSLK